MRTRGFEIRDCLAWMYGSGFPKSKNVALAIDKGEGHPNRGRAIPTASSYQASDDERENKLTSNPVEAYSAKSAAAKSWEGYGTALKPAYEPIVLARKPLAGTVAANVLKHGTGALNIDGCRIKAIERPARAKDAKPEANGSVYAGRQKPGSGFDGGSKAVGTTDLGRWPANVVLDEEGAAMLDEQSGTLTSGSGALRRNADKFRTAYGVFTGTDEPADVLYGDSGGASRFFYTAKASRADRGEGNDHPTVKPVDLMRWLVRLVTAPGHVVLDPFAGSGTTLQACIAENRRCIGIEQDEHYCELILNRLGRPIQVSLL